MLNNNKKNVVGNCMCIRSSDSVCVCVCMHTFVHQRTYTNHTHRHVRIHTSYKHKKKHARIQTHHSTQRSRHLNYSLTENLKTKKPNIISAVRKKAPL